MTTISRHLSVHFYHTRQKASPAPLGFLQEGFPLAILSPEIFFSFVTLSDQLFIHDPSVVWWYKRSVHLPWVDRQLLNATSCRTTDLTP